MSGYSFEFAPCRNIKYQSNNRCHWLSNPFGTDPREGSQTRLCQITLEMIKRALALVQAYFPDMETLAVDSQSGFTHHPQNKSWSKNCRGTTFPFQYGIDLGSELNHGLVICSSHAFIPGKNIPAKVFRKEISTDLLKGEMGLQKAWSSLMPWNMKLLGKALPRPGKVGIWRPSKRERSAVFLRSCQRKV